LQAAQRNTRPTFGGLESLTTSKDGVASGSNGACAPQWGQSREVGCACSKLLSLLT
jgi:hypothetical protein